MFAYMILTGDFPGSDLVGVDEDHPLVAFALQIHALLTALGILS